MNYNSNTPFKLMYNQLYLVDEEKLKQLNPVSNLSAWVNIQKEDDVTISMREKVAILMPHIDQVNLYEKNAVINEFKGSNIVREAPKILISQQTSINEIIKNTVKPSSAANALQETQLESTNNGDNNPITNLANPIFIDNWDDLTASVQACTKCDLAKNRQNSVIERGNRNAKWMFVGEAPGENEDIQGLPFVGKSGELLNKMICAMNLDTTNDAYICNVVKCRPPANRNPDPKEIQQCNNFLLSQINLVKPKIIVTLGRFAIQSILNTTAAINQLRGKIYKFNNIVVVPTFHPSYLLRAPSAKKDAWEDLQLAMQIFKELSTNDGNY